MNNYEQLKAKAYKRMGTNTHEPVNEILSRMLINVNCYCVSQPDLIKDNEIGELFFLLIKLSDRLNLDLEQCLKNYLEYE